MPHGRNEDGAPTPFHCWETLGGLLKYNSGEAHEFFEHMGPAPPNLKGLTRYQDLLKSFDWIS